MQIKLPTDETMIEVVTSLYLAVETNHFSVMHVLNIKRTMIKKGVDFDLECLTFEIFQPQQAKRILEQNMGVSTV
ncbi:MAG: hypothetical protein ACI9E1_000023 [Cryomorphaceae bacterium]|jgi:uncharacterized protein (DUF302 family)